MPYKPAPWERIEDGVLYGPGYAVDLADGSVVHFSSPSSMGYGPKKSDSARDRVRDDPELRKIDDDVVAAGGGETFVRYDSDVGFGDTHLNDRIEGVVIGDVEGVDVVTYGGKLVERLRPAT